MKRRNTQSLNGFARQETTKIKLFESDVNRNQDKGVAMDKIYSLYHVRDDAMGRFDNGERNGPGISRTFASWRWMWQPDDFAGTAPGYPSYQIALDRLIEFAKWHTGYDWDRIYDDWTLEDVSSNGRDHYEMAKHNLRDFTKHQQHFVAQVRREERMRWRKGWLRIGDVPEEIDVTPRDESDGESAW